MKKKTLYTARAITFAILTVVFGTSPLWGEVRIPMWSITLFCIFLAFVSYGNFEKSRKMKMLIKKNYLFASTHTSNTRQILAHLAYNPPDSPTIFHRSKSMHTKVGNYLQRFRFERLPICCPRF